MPVNILITGLSSIQFVSANNVSESIPVLSIKEYIGLRKVRHNILSYLLLLLVDGICARLGYQRRRLLPCSRW